MNKMGKTLNFIFEYNDYIGDIYNKNDVDDKIIFDKMTSLRIVEGLIKTHPINISISILKKRFPYLSYQAEEDGEIFIEGDFLELSNYLPIFNNLGYFISKYTIDGDNWVQKFDNKTKPAALLLEPRYDIKIDPLPDILYHASESKFDRNIKNIGLIPKSKGKLSNHPERIYLTDNIDIAKNFGLNIKMTQKCDFSIYKIDTKGLDINLYIDINLKNGGFYTSNNIHPKFITKL